MDGWMDGWMGLLLVLLVLVLCRRLVLRVVVARLLRGYCSSLLARFITCLIDTSVD